MSTFDLVKKVVLEWVKVDPARVTPEATWVEDLGFDHDDPFELALALMEEFQTDRSLLDAFEKTVTVGDLLAYLDARAEVSALRS
jgi:acyl carrier protein